MRIVKEVRNSRRDIEDSAHLGQLVRGHYPTAHREYGELPRSFGGLMWVVFPRSFFASPYVSFSVVQHTSSSFGIVEFTNNTWRYVALYTRMTDVLQRDVEGNILTIGLQTPGTLSVAHLTELVPQETKEGGCSIFRPEYHAYG